MVKELKCCLKHLEHFVKHWDVCNIHSHLRQLVTLSCIKVLQELFRFERCRVELGDEL